jgi:xanthine dehydrogenase accessory factor
MENCHLHELILVIKSAGEMASGVAWRLHRAGFKRICMLEVPTPLAVRRRVSFCEAVYDGRMEVDGVTAEFADCGSAMDQDCISKIHGAWQRKNIAVIIDPEWQLLKLLKPQVLIDGILAKKNLGTSVGDAPLTIAMGPGFSAGRDADIVIETMRGHHLGRVIEEGCALADTRVPGVIAGYSIERVLRAPQAGVFKSKLALGDMVRAGQVVGHVGQSEVKAKIGGILRGLIRDGAVVSHDLKLGDVDPRGKADHMDTVSDKARALGGSVLEVILSRYNRPAD